MNVHVCVSLCVGATHMWGEWRPEEGMGSPGMGSEATVSYMTWSLGTKLGSFRRAAALSTPEKFLQPPKSF